MKKIISLMLLLLIITSLTACGHTVPSAIPDTEEGSAAPTAEASYTEASHTEAPVSGGTVTVWCWDPAFNIYAMEEAAKVYKRVNPNFELNVVETPWEDVQTKLTAAAAAKRLDTLPDIFLCQDNAFQKFVITYPEVFTDITNSGIDFSKFASAKVAYSVLGGKNYGVPFDNGAVITCLHTDAIQEAGYSISDFTGITWDTFIELGKSILETTGKPLLSFITREPDLIMIMLQSAGSSLFNGDGTPNIVNNTELKEAMRVFNELVTSGICIEVNSWDEYTATFINKTVAGTINGCRILAYVRTADDQSDWAVTNLPKLDIPGGTNYSNNGGSSWAVTTSSGNPDLAIDFLAKTFAGSVEFYETILPASGALATYLPVGESPIYGEPQPFFAGQKIYKDIINFAGKVPSVTTGAYYFEARDAVGAAMNSIITGMDVDTALRDAEDTVTNAMP